MNVYVSRVIVAKFYLCSMRLNKGIAGYQITKSGSWFKMKATSSLSERETSIDLWNFLLNLVYIYS
jgi:hypothetical protein